MVESLVRDPISKSEFYLLQADKKFMMGIMLAADKKTKDADMAFAEARDAHMKSISLLEGQRKAGASVPRHVPEKLIMSIGKHMEVLSENSLPTGQLDDIKKNAEALLGSL